MPSTIEKRTAEHFDLQDGEWGGGYEDYLLITCEHGEVAEAEDHQHAQVLAACSPDWCAACAAPFRNLSRCFDREPHDARDLAHDRLRPEEAGRGW